MNLYFRFDGQILPIILKGVWTRFYPLVQKFRDLVFKEKAIGDIKHVVSDFGIARLDGKFPSIPLCNYFLFNVQH